jgi:hypothetical protein
MNMSSLQQQVRMDLCSSAMLVHLTDNNIFSAGGRVPSSVTHACALPSVHAVKAPVHASLLLHM